MTFTEFMSKWNGKYLDFDGAYGPQCMDLMHQYCVEVLGLSDPKILAAPGAKDVYNNYPNITGAQYFERIPNTPDGIPQEGDIMFWNTGTWGHVAIALGGGTTSNFQSFDQNWPTGSFCHVQSHTYSNVLGWLRFKGQNTANELKTCLEQHTALVTELDKVKQQYRQLSADYQRLDDDLDAKNAENLSYQNYVKQLATTLHCEVDTAKILGAITGLLNAEDRAREIEKKLATLENTHTGCGIEKAQLENSVQVCTTEKQSLSKALQEATDNVKRLEEELATNIQTHEVLFRVSKLGICKIS